MKHDPEQTAAKTGKWTDYRCRVCCRAFRVLAGTNPTWPEDCMEHPPAKVAAKGTIASGPVPTVPLRDMPGAASYQGVCAVKPWEYQVTVALPCLDHAEETAVCVELLRRQTVRPYFVLVDTGSRPEEFAKIEAMRSHDLEVHRLALNGFYYGSSSVGFALDLCFGRAETPYVFTTHQDCFVRQRDFLEFLIRECKDRAAVGYRLSPRFHVDWERMFGHTATLFDIAHWDALGATWALRRAARAGKIERADNPVTPDGAWPDTESAMNITFLAAGAKTKFVGTEENYARNRDHWIDHVRSLVGSSLWNPGYNAKAREWMTDALREARERLAAWDDRTPVSVQPGNVIEPLTAEQLDARKAVCDRCAQRGTADLAGRGRAWYCALDLEGPQCNGCVTQAVGQWQARVTGSPPKCEKWPSN